MTDRSYGNRGCLWLGEVVTVKFMADRGYDGSGYITVDVIAVAVIAGRSYDSSGKNKWLWH